MWIKLDKRFYRRIIGFSSLDFHGKTEIVIAMKIISDTRCICEGYQGYSGYYKYSIHTVKFNRKIVRTGEIVENL